MGSENECNAMNENVAIQNAAFLMIILSTNSTALCMQCIIYVYLLYILLNLRASRKGCFGRALNILGTGCTDTQRVRSCRAKGGLFSNRQSERQYTKGISFDANPNIRECNRNYGKFIFFGNVGCFWQDSIMRIYLPLSNSHIFSHKPVIAVIAA